MRKGPVDYDCNVYCSRCAVKYLKEYIKLIPNWGYKCPTCGSKCRVKPKYNYQSRRRTNPYTPSNTKPYQVVKEIKAIAQAERMA